jgi:hypothetical protein
VTSIEKTIIDELVDSLETNELLTPELIASIRDELSKERGPNADRLAELFRSGQEIK